MRLIYFPLAGTVEQRHVTLNQIEGVAQHSRCAYTTDCEKGVCAACCAPLDVGGMGSANLGRDTGSDSTLSVMSSVDGAWQVAIDLELVGQRGKVLTKRNTLPCH